MYNNNKKVLIVDDNVNLLATLNLGLTSKGYRVHCLSSLIAIDATITELEPSIILLDVEIYDKDGIKESEKIHKRFPDIPIIFISSHIDNDYIARSLKVGGVKYMKKPIDINELVVYVEHYINQKHFKLSCIYIGNCVIYQDKKLIKNKITKSEYNLSPKEYDLLLFLIKRKNDFVTREEIFKCAWDDKFTSNQSLTNNILKLRKYIADDKSLNIILKKNSGYMLKII